MPANIFFGFWPGVIITMWFAGPYWLAILCGKKSNNFIFGCAVLIYIFGMLIVSAIFTKNGDFWPFVVIFFAPPIFWATRRLLAAKIH